MNNKSFSPIIIVIVVVVIALVGIVGWRVMPNDSSNKQQVVQSTKQESESIVIENSSDVANAESGLSNINLESDLDSSLLDEDISNLQ